MKEVVKKIYVLGFKYVLIKGGSKFGMEIVIDVLYDGEIFEFLELEKIDIINIYGVGCIYFVVIIVEFVKGKFVKEVVKIVKEFIIVVICYLFKINEYVGLIYYGVYCKFVVLKEFV